MTPAPVRAEQELSGANLGALTALLPVGAGPARQRLRRLWLRVLQRRQRRSQRPDLQWLYLAKSDQWDRCLLPSTAPFLTLSASSPVVGRGLSSRMELE